MNKARAGANSTNTILRDDGGPDKSPHPPYQALLIADCRSLP